MPLPQAFEIRLRSGQLITFHRPAVMGIINTTPDSFFNPHLSISAAFETACRMIEEGVDILDIGGEATNPNVSAPAVSMQQELELARVIPVIEAVRARFNVLISVDTSQPQVMHAAVAAGADMINDQRHLSEPGALEAVAALQTPVCLMHGFNVLRQAGCEPADDLFIRVKNDLLDYARACLAVGIMPDRIILDPGFGQGHYGKNVKENFYLLARLPELVDCGFPVLSGWSRKSMIGDVLGGVPPQERLFGTVAADAIALLHGANILRTHDVRAAVDTAKVVGYLRSGERSFRHCERSEAISFNR